MIDIDELIEQSTWKLRGGAFLYRHHTVVQVVVDQRVWDDVTHSFWLFWDYGLHDPTPKIASTWEEVEHEIDLVSE